MYDIKKIIIYYIPSSEILEFSRVINSDIISSDDSTFSFTSCRNLGTTFFIKHLSKVLISTFKRKIKNNNVKTVYNR